MRGFLGRLTGSSGQWLSGGEDRVELEDYIPGGLDALALQENTIDEVIKKIGELRGRPIVVVPWVLPARMYGARLASLGEDYIIYEQNTAAPHQSQIKAHELGHILAGHAIAQITPDTSFEESVSVLLRSEEGGDNWAEREAEAFASTIEDALNQRFRLKALTSTLATAPVWDKLAHGLGLDL